jgi:copper chaperone NosL
MKKSSLLMIIGSLLLLGLFYYPLWNIQLGAPQYPDPLGMDIYIHGIEGQEEFDIQNIDGVNKYIGMKKIPKAEEMWEFDVFPKVITGMIILGVIIGLLAFFRILNHNWFLGWFLLMAILGILGMYDFNMWLLDYGTDLDPKAILKLTDLEGNPLSYKPPLFGTDKILNFTASSFPGIGGYMMFGGMALTLLAFFVGRKEYKNLTSKNA